MRHFSDDVAGWAFSFPAGIAVQDVAAIVALLGIVVCPILFAVVHYQRRQRALRSWKCPVCGYLNRASSNRCPCCDAEPKA